MSIELDEHYFKIGTDRIEKHLLMLDYKPKIVNEIWGSDIIKEYVTEEPVDGIYYLGPCYTNEENYYNGEEENG